MARKKGPSRPAAPTLLQKLVEAAQRKEASYALSQLGKKREAASVLAEALVAGTVELDARARSTVYAWLSRAPQRGSLPSNAVFDKGLSDRSEHVRSICREVLGGDQARSAARDVQLDALREEGLREEGLREETAGAETAGAETAGAAGDPALFDRIRAELAPSFPAVVPLEHLASRLGLAEAQARAEVAAMVAGWLETPAPPYGSPTLRPYLHTCGARYGSTRDPFHEMLAPDPHALEKLAETGRLAELDAALAATHTKPAALPFTPVVRWRDGSPLSPGARNWLSAALFSNAHVHRPTDGEQNASRPVRGGVEVIGVALDRADLRALVVQTAQCRPPAPPYSSRASPRTTAARSQRRSRVRSPVATRESSSGTKDTAGAMAARAQ